MEAAKLKVGTRSRSISLSPGMKIPAQSISQVSVLLADHVKILSVWNYSLSKFPYMSALKPPPPTKMLTSVLPLQIFTVRRKLA